MNVTIPPPSNVYQWRGTVTTSAQSLAALAPAFQTSHAYSVGQVFSLNNIAYAVVSAGTSGSTSPVSNGVGSIADASNSPSAPTYRALTNLQRVTIRNLDTSGASIDIGNSSVTAGGGIPIVGGQGVIGEAFVQAIESASEIYVIAGGNVSVAIEVY